MVEIGLFVHLNAKTYQPNNIVFRPSVSEMGSRQDDSLVELTGN